MEKWRRRWHPLQCSCLENPMGAGAWWAAVHGSLESDTTERLHFHFSLSCIGEGKGNQLQCSCLENPMDAGACWSTVYGVSKCWTRLSNVTFTFSLSRIGEGNGNPLQCSCLENLRGRRAWWADVYGVTQSRTRLNRLSSSSRPSCAATAPLRWGCFSRPLPLASGMG